MKTYISKIKRSRMPITTYQVVEPSVKRCCMCKCQVASENVKELRPTGFNGKVQRWTFCDICYVDYNQSCNLSLYGRMLQEIFQHKDIPCHSNVRTPSFRFR